MSSTLATKLETKVLSPLLGGEVISPIDLAADSSGDVIAQLEAALYRHQILVIPNQSLDAAQYAAFARRLGRPEPHMITQFRHPQHPEILTLSNVKLDGVPIGLADGGSHWHTDYAFLEVPAKATMLHSIQVPKVGGNTLFANMYLAYDALTESMKRRLATLKVLHCYGTRPTKENDARALAAIKSAPAIDKISSAVHPLVCEHPVTRRKTLYAPVGTAFRIVDMPDDESDDLLDELKVHATQEAFQFSLSYRIGDVVIWDNPSLLHRATLTAPDDARTLRRITVMMDAGLWRSGDTSETR